MYTLPITKIANWAKEPLPDSVYGQAQGLAGTFQAWPYGSTLDGLVASSCGSGPPLGS